MMTSEIDRTQFYSGGFFLIRSGHPGWEQLDAELLPPKLVSLSDCMSPRFNILWTWIPGNKEAALAFGIPDSKWDDLKAWCSKEYQKKIDLGGMFHSLADAQYFIQEFIPDTTDLYIIEAGLPRFLEAQYWREETPDDHTETGIEVRIPKQIPLLDGGTILGFEVVGFEYSNLSHSWLCSYLHRDMYELYGIRPNGYGLIDKFDDAKKVYEWIAEDEMRGRRAEPIPYDFWLLVSHPLESENNS